MPAYTFAMQVNLTPGGETSTGIGRDSGQYLQHAHEHRQIKTKRCAKVGRMVWPIMGA